MTTLVLFPTNWANGTFQTKNNADTKLETKKLSPRKVPDLWQQMGRNVAVPQGVSISDYHILLPYCRECREQYALFHRERNHDKSLVNVRGHWFLRINTDIVQNLSPYSDLDLKNIAVLDHDFKAIMNKLVSKVPLGSDGEIVQWENYVPVQVWQYEAKLSIRGTKPLDPKQKYPRKDDAKTGVFHLGFQSTRIVEMEPKWLRALLDATEYVDDSFMTAWGNLLTDEQSLRHLKMLDPVDRNFFINPLDYTALKNTAESQDVKIPKKVTNILNNNASRVKRGGRKGATIGVEDKQFQNAFTFVNYRINRFTTVPEKTSPREENNHWGLIYIDFARRTIYWLDGLNNGCTHAQEQKLCSNQEWAQHKRNFSKIANWIWRWKDEKNRDEKFEVQRIIVPPQLDTQSCGVYACYLAILLCLNIRMPLEARVSDDEMRLVPRTANARNYLVTIKQLRTWMHNLIMEHVISEDRAREIETQWKRNAA